MCMTMKTVVRRKDKLVCRNNVSVIGSETCLRGSGLWFGAEGFVCAESHQTEPGTWVISCMGFRLVYIV